MADAHPYRPLAREVCAICDRPLVFVDLLTGWYRSPRHPRVVCVECYDDMVNDHGRIDAIVRTRVLASGALLTARYRRALGAVALGAAAAWVAAMALGAT